MHVMIVGCAPDVKVQKKFIQCVQERGPHIKMACFVEFIPYQ